MTPAELAYKHALENQWRLGGLADTASRRYHDAVSRKATLLYRWTQEQTPERRAAYEALEAQMPALQTEMVETAAAHDAAKAHAGELAAAVPRGLPRPSLQYPRRRNRTVGP